MNSHVMTSRSECTRYMRNRGYRVIAALTVLCAGLSIAQPAQVSISVSRDIEVIKLSEHTYVHFSYAEMPPWGRVGSNGLIFTSKGEALLFDTPVNDSLTKTLVDWMTDSLKVRIVGFVPNHWHEDCMGGLACLHAMGIPSYAQQKTIAIAREKHLPCPRHSFVDSLILKAGDDTVVCRYLGAGHTVDNIVAWVPSERVLFGGCMVKELKSGTLGNVRDADRVAWPETIRRVLATFGDARIVVPGHGAIGGPDLLFHTEALLGAAH